MVCHSWETKHKNMGVNIPIKLEGDPLTLRIAFYDIARVDSLNYSDAGSASLCSTCHNLKLALFYAI